MSDICEQGWLNGVSGLFHFDRHKIPPLACIRNHLSNLVYLYFFASALQCICIPSCICISTNLCLPVYLHPYLYLLTIVFLFLPVFAYQWVADRPISRIFDWAVKEGSALSLHRDVWRHVSKHRNLLRIPETFKCIWTFLKGKTDIVVESFHYQKWLQPVRRTKHMPSLKFQSFKIICFWRHFWAFDLHCFHMLSGIYLDIFQRFSWQVVCKMPLKAVYDNQPFLDYFTPKWQIYIVCL